MLLSTCACSSGGEKKKKTDDFSMDNVISYDEKEMCKAIGINNSGVKMTLDSNECLNFTDSADKSKSLFCIDNNGKKVEKVKSDVMDGYLNIFTFDSKNNLYVISEKYGANKEGGNNREVTYALNIYDSKGQMKKSVNLGKRTFTKYQGGITDIAADSKGNTYILFKKDHIEVIDADGKKVKDITDKKVDFIETDEKDKLIMGSFGDNGVSSVEKYDVIKDQSIWTKSLEMGNCIKEMKYNLKTKKLYLLTEQGILACSSDGIIEGFILDMKKTSLMDSSIYTYDFAIDSNKIVYIIAFKTNGNDSSPLLYKYTPQKEQSLKKQKTLKIELRYSEKLIETAISKYEKAHPDIKVEVSDSKAVHMGTSDEEAKRAKKAEEDFTKIINTELMSGKGADVVEVTGLSYQRYAEKNALANITELINNDKSFDINNYQQNVLNSCKYKDNLYIIPINFVLSTFIANKSILQEENISIDDSKWTWKDFLSIAQRITKDKDGDGKPDQYALMKLPAMGIFADIYDNESSNFIDYDTKTATFDSKEFVDLLNLVKDFTDKKVSSPTLDISQLLKYNDPGTIGFLSTQMNSFLDPIFNQCLFNGEVDYLKAPSVSGSGNAYRLSPYRTFAISNNSKMKSEAWDFIKLLLSEESQSSADMNAFPVSKSALKSKAKDEMARNFHEWLKQQYASRNIKPLTQADIDCFNKIIDEAEPYKYSESQANKIIKEGVDKFFSGKKTAQEAAKDIQNKINIYLNE